MPTKSRGYNELLPGLGRHKHKNLHKPGTCNKGGEAMLHCFRGNIDYAIVYNTTGAHAAEVRVGTFRHALEAVLANHNTLDQLTSLSSLCISEGGAS